MQLILRAKEDYLMGINFSRLLTLQLWKLPWPVISATAITVISVGRVMTCVLGMVVRREREIRTFVKTPFYRVLAGLNLPEGKKLEAEWRVTPKSAYYNHPALYKENGFKEKKEAQHLIDTCKTDQATWKQKSYSWRKNRKRKIHRFCTIWPNCKMTVPGCSRSVRMRL